MQKEKIIEKLTTAKEKTFEKLAIAKEKISLFARNTFVPFLKGIWRWFVDVVKNNRKASIAAASAVCALVIVIVIAGITSRSQYKDLDTDEQSQGVQKKEWSSPSLIAEIDGDRYEVKEKGGLQYLFKNKKKVKKTDISNVPVMSFNMDSAGETDDISGFQDSAKPGGTGSRVYRGKTYVWEQYLSHLKKNGYTVSGYILTGSYADIYLDKGNIRYRFLVVRKTKDTSTLLFARYTGTGPKLSINEMGSTHS